MHEMSIAVSAYRICRESADRHGAARLERVRMAVGEMASVEPALLRSAWEAVVAGSPDEGSRLEIEFRPALQTCAACGPVPGRAPGSWLRLCPACERPLRVEGGRELDVLDLTLKVDDDV